jgi:hypothetical protein
LSCLQLSCLQLHAGISSPIFERNQHIDYIQDTWFNEIKTFLKTCNAKIKINSLWLPSLSRYNDKFIMEELHSENALNATALLLIIG